MNQQSNHKKSRLLYNHSLECLPGGVNSPVRAFKAVGGSPVFITRAKGAYLYDVDGNRYLDYVGSWGPAIVGHAHPQVVRKVRTAATRGLSFGATTELELILARSIKSGFPSIEEVRLVNSGTEATMSAIRLARAYTGKTKIVKFNGCYHGHADSFLVKAGSGSATFAIPDSAGISSQVVKDTISLPFNNSEAVIRTFDRKRGEIAALIVEPVAGNMGLVLPEPGFLKTLREVTRHYHALLVFDEILTGFRICFGGAQHIYRITPDITCLGKIIGGGLPIGAYGGKADIMEMVSPQGPVYQAGTLSGNPLATTAGIATLTMLSKSKKIYKQLDVTAKNLCEGIREIAKKNKVSLKLSQLGSMFTLFFSEKRVTNYQEARECDLKMFAHYFHIMLGEGVYLPPSQFETNF
ncbi:MAG: glutamate-1-semialdehyde aminotransferase, partial [Deltaproteobacteria bacterium DG_8]